MDKSVYRQGDLEIKGDTEIIDPAVGWHERVIKQVEEEYWAAWWFHKPRVQEWMDRLKLYNNQKRDKSRIGSPDIFAFHQTLLANLYDDKMSWKFGGRMEQDDDAADNLNILAENDYDDMRLAEVDYQWDFDASLFGRSLLGMDDYDYESETPMCEVWDPLTTLRDPSATSVNGNTMGQGSARFLGREIRRTNDELHNNAGYFNLEFLKKDSQGFRTFSPYWDAERARKDAQGFQTPFQSYTVSKNLDWTILQWYTIIDGQKYKLELGNDRKLIIRMDRIKRKTWPIVDRTLYPIAHDWDGVSVFDIMEDKQRFRAQLMNIYGDAVKLNVYPMRVFDENKIRKNVDKDADFNKWIPVDGDPTKSYQNVTGSSPTPDVQFAMDFLDKASQKALGISELSLGQQPAKKGQVGQMQLQQSKSDMRHGLALKIWGWSEKQRAHRWYEQYEDNFDGGISKKILRIEGQSGREYRKIKSKDIVVSHAMGPSIKIETKSDSEARKLRAYQQMKDYYQEAAQLPESDKLYGMRELGKLVMPANKVKFLIPYSVDERISLQENEKLNKGEVVPVKVQDNHLVHLRVHEQCKDTPEATAHIKMHETAIVMKRTQPQAFPQINPEGQNPADVQMQGNSSGAKKDPKQFARPAIDGMGTASKPQ